MALSWLVWVMLLLTHSKSDLPSSAKLKDVKSAAQPGTTLMHFLVNLLEEKHPGLTTFTDELLHVHHAARGNEKKSSVPGVHGVNS